jgi:hypothetical protein
LQENRQQASKGVTHNNRVYWLFVVMRRSEHDGRKRQERWMCTKTLEESGSVAFNAVFHTWFISLVVMLGMAK